MNALVFGSDLITVGSLKHLIKCSAINKLEVVTPKTSKKSPPIKFCNLNNICYHYLPSNIDFKLTNYNIPTTQKWDIGILVSFGYFIPKRIISLFPNGIINVHPSLLPQYIGCSPIPYSLLNGDKITGISIIDVNAKLDNGNILKQESLLIDNDDNYMTLSNKLADFGGMLLCDTILNLKKYRENSIPQNNNIDNIKHLYGINKDDKFELVKTKKIDKNMSYIDWRLSIKQTFNQHRAINGLLKNSRTILGTKYDDKKLLILIDKLVIVEMDKNIFTKNDDIGTIKYCKDNDVLIVKCGDNDNDNDNDEDDSKTSEYLGIKQLRIAPSLSCQHLANFDNFINEFGNFLTHCDANDYKQYSKHLKNHF